MFPVIPLLASVASVLGLGTLVWYQSLSKEERARADRLTATLAQNMFQKAVEDLSRSEAQAVHDRVKQYFTN